MTFKTSKKALWMIVFDIKLDYYYYYKSPPLFYKGYAYELIVPFYKAFFCKIELYVVATSFCLDLRFPRFLQHLR
jgi:hypothetical protein